MQATSISSAWEHQVQKRHLVLLCGKFPKLQQEFCAFLQDDRCDLEPQWTHCRQWNPDRQAQLLLSMNSQLL